MVIQVKLYTNYRNIFIFVYLLTTPVARAQVSFDDPDESDEEMDEDDQENNRIIGFRNLTSTSNRKSTTKSKKHQLPTSTRQLSPKRSRTDEILSSNTNQNKRDANQSSVLKDFNHTIDQLRKQVSILVLTLDQQKKVLNLILENQKKMVKAMRHHQVIMADLKKSFISFLKIPVLLVDEIESNGTPTTNNNNSVVSHNASFVSKLFSLGL